MYIENWGYFIGCVILFISNVKFLLAYRYRLVKRCDCAVPPGYDGYLSVCPLPDDEKEAHATEG